MAGRSATMTVGFLSKPKLNLGRKVLSALFQENLFPLVDILMFSL
jgi:hypothetical protein